MKKIIECVPNFSEGKDLSKIKLITDAIKSVTEIRVLNVDSGKATNRTVITLIGEPGDVVESAFRGIKKAAEVIDMRYHSGKHPRIGATDVCPLVPISNITLDEVIVYARRLSKRVGEELQIPVFCYESAAFKEERRNLANCRSGEYEALKDRITGESWKPDFGPSEWNGNIAKSGATAIGARDILVAFNINLDTTSKRLAGDIASEVRESGRFIGEGESLNTSFKTYGKKGNRHIPGTLKKTQAIGWFIEEYGKAQVSMNLSDISVTPVHIAFDEVCQKANERGLRVTGSEIIGLVPLKVLLDAGKYFLKKQNQTSNLTEEELIKVAIKSLGLDELYPFDPNKKIIEYLMADHFK